MSLFYSDPHPAYPTRNQLDDEAAQEAANDSADFAAKPYRALLALAKLAGLDDLDWLNEAAYDAGRPDAGDEYEPSAMKPDAALAYFAKLLAKGAA
jgi:hypothetical protein